MITDRINHKVKTTFNAIDTGKNIAMYRDQKGWSQKELADKIACSRWMIDLIERGQAEPTISTIAKIATALSVCAEWLLVWDEEIIDET